MTSFIRLIILSLFAIIIYCVLFTTINVVTVAQDIIFYVYIEIPTMIFDWILGIMPASGHTSTNIEIATMAVATIFALALPVIWCLLVTVMLIRLVIISATSSRTNY